MGVRTINKLRPLRDEVEEPPAEIPQWRIRPTRAPLAVQMTESDLLGRIDDYFERTHKAGLRPTLCDLAGEAGFDSVEQLINHARRRGKTTMRGISRALTAVAATYEDLVQQGNRQAQLILQQIPQFDTENHQAAPPVRSFEPRYQIPIHIVGVARPEDQGRQMTEQEAYMKLIKNKTYQDAEVIDVQLNAEGTYGEIDLDKLTNE